MKFTLINKIIEVPGIESFVFTPAEALTWKPGQYAHYRLPHDSPDARGIERWFTVSSAPFEKDVMITTRLAPEKGSTFKAALAALKIGGSIESDYVDGDFIIEDVTQEHVFIAGGIGITPFHSILKQAEKDGVKFHITLIYANRDENIVFKNEIESWAKNNPNLSVHYLIVPERVDEKVISRYVSDLQKPLFYLSGPEPMVKSLDEMIKGLGVPADRIKLDDFPGYPAE